MPAAAKQHRLTHARLAALVGVVGLGLSLALGARAGVVAPPEGLSAEGLVVAGVMLVMAGFWILEAMPFAATGLLPLVLFPLLGVLPAKDIAKAYVNSTVLLLMGGFFLAKGLERWRVPHLMARVVERWASGSPTALLLGLMGTTAFLSMWLSNTATALVMVTVAEAALARAHEVPENRPRDLAGFRLALLLGVAYAANMGGLATPVGTAPNLLLLSIRKELDPTAPPIAFVEWMILTVPLVLVLVPAIGVLLARVLSPFSRELRLGRREEGAVPPLVPAGRRALVIFSLTALLWIFRSDVDLGFFKLPGWAGLLGLGKKVDDATVAMLGVVLMFLCPAGGSVDGEARGLSGRLRSWLSGERVLDWESANRIPWYLLLLFGGGIALADAFSSSGLSAWLGDQLVWLKGAPPWLIVLALCLGMSLLTEVTSNTATTTLVLPVLFAAAGALDLPPLLLMWPATLCASAAFILPISTPPNAIVAGAGPISPLEMARVGVWLNLLAVVLVTLVAMLWLVPRMGLSW